MFVLLPLSCTQGHGDSGMAIGSLKHHRQKAVPSEPSVVALSPPGCKDTWVTKECGREGMSGCKNP